MKKHILAIVLAGLGAVAAADPQQPKLNPKTAALASPEDRFEFIPNRGQWNPHVKFLGHSPGIDMWITDKGVTYSYYNKKKGHSVDMSFVGGRKISSVTGFGKRENYYNYFLGKDRSQWFTKVPVYSSVKVKDVYKGVDLVAYFDMGKRRPRYDLVIKPGADASKIAMRYEGAKNLRVNSKGTLAYDTRLGKVEERDLFAYQPKSGYDIDTNRVALTERKRKALAQVTSVDARMAMADDGLVRFKLGRRNLDKPLVIDPVIWAVPIDRFGGTSPAAIAVGPDDSVYVTGRSTKDYFDITGYNHNYDYNKLNGPTIYVTRIAADGNSLIYNSMFVDSAIPKSIAVAADGSAVFGGYDASPTYPVTENAWIKSVSLEGSFLTKLSPDGSQLIFSTFIGAGGYNDNILAAIALGSGGEVYVTGLTTASLVMPPGAMETNMTESSEGYCLKLLPDGSGIAAGTYLPLMNPRAIALDANQSVYIAGAFGGAAVLKLDSNLSTRLYRKVCPALSAWATCITVDSDGSAYIAGIASYSDYPVTEGAFITIRPSATCSFLTKISPDGSSIEFSTYIGRNESPFGFPNFNAAFTEAIAIVLDGQGFPCVIGRSNCVTVTADADRNARGGGFASKFSKDGKYLLFSTYVGAEYNDNPRGAARAANGDILVLDLVYGEDGTYPITGSFINNTAGVANAYWQGVERIHLQCANGLSFSSETPTGGTPITGTYSFAIQGPGVVNVALSSTPAGLSLPSSVAVSLTETSATFPIVAPPVDETTKFDITAVNPISDTQVTRSITINPAVPTGFALSTNQALGKTSVTGTVTLDGPSGHSGVTVTVASSDPTVATVPSTVTIPSGQTSAPFSVAALGVKSAGATTITVRDSKGNLVGEETLSVESTGPVQVTVGSILFYPGQEAVGTVRLNRRALSGGTEVTLASSDPALNLPASVVVPEDSNSASFPVSLSAGYSGPSAKVTVTASAGSASVTARTTIKANLLSRLTLSGTTFSSGDKVVATIELREAAPSGGFTVALASGDPSMLTVPAAVVVPAGQTTLKVDLGVPSSFKGAASTVTVTASASGVVKSRSLTVTRLRLASVVLSPSDLKGGDDATFTVTLSAAPTVDTTVTLAVGSPVASVPATLVIRAGTKSGAVTVTTSPVTAKTSTNVSATLQGTTKRNRLTLHP